MNDKQKKEKILVSIDVSVIEELTKDGSKIQDKIRTALSGLLAKEEKQGIEFMKGEIKQRHSMRQVLQLLKVIEGQGKKIEIPFPNERPLMLLDYGNKKSQPKIITLDTVADLYHYLQDVWIQSVIAGLCTSI